MYITRRGNTRPKANFAFGTLRCRFVQPKNKFAACPVARGVKGQALQMKFKCIMWVAGVITSLYLAGFFLLYPLMANYTSGVEPGHTIAQTAGSLHNTFYRPFLNLLGGDSEINKIWYENATYWCNRVNGKEWCETHP